MINVPFHQSQTHVLLQLHKVHKTILIQWPTQPNLLELLQLFVRQLLLSLLLDGIKEKIVIKLVHFWGRMRLAVNKHTK